MTSEQFEICQGLAHHVSCLPGTFDKRFMRSIEYFKPDTELTEKQSEWVYRLLFKYRKQLPNLYSKHQNNPLCKRL